MIFTGKITWRSEEQTGKSIHGEWKKRSFIVETMEQYPDQLLITAFNDKLDKLDTIQDGEVVECSLNPRVREYNGKRYQDMALYKITKVEVAETATAPAPATEKAVKATQYMEAATAKPKPAPVAGNVFDVNPQSTAGDDLPF